MDYLQYIYDKENDKYVIVVLNLVINGLPSIQKPKRKRK